MSLVPLYKSLMFFVLLLVSSSSILALRYAFFLFLKCLLASHLTLFWLSTLLCLGSCTYCKLASFLWLKNPKHSSTNHGLWCFNSCRPRLYLPEVLMFSLMFSQALFMSSSSLTFSKAANLFVISIWYYFLTSSTFSFLRLNLSPSNLCASCLLTAKVYLRMFQCRRIIILTRIFDVAMSTILTPLSLLSWCRLSFPIIALKIFSLPFCALKSPNRIFIW